MSTHRIRILEWSCETCGAWDRESYRLEGDLVVPEHIAEAGGNKFVQQHLAEFPHHVTLGPVVSVGSEEDSEAQA